MCILSTSGAWHAFACAWPRARQTRCVSHLIRTWPEMDAESAKPRVNGSMLAKHMGQYVCLVGKNMAVANGGGSMTLESSDGKRITVKFPRPLQDPLDPYVEVLGCVNEDLTITVERIVNYGTDFDLEAYNEVLLLASNFPQLFSPSEAKNEMAMQF